MGGGHDKQNLKHNQSHINEKSVQHPEVMENMHFFGFIPEFVKKSETMCPPKPLALHSQLLFGHLAIYYLERFGAEAVIGQ